MSREGIRDKVAVVGVGCCRFGENWDQSASDMIVDAAYEAYADAGIEDPQKQIDAVFTDKPPEDRFLECLTSADVQVYTP